MLPVRRIHVSNRFADQDDFRCGKSESEDGHHFVGVKQFFEEILAVRRIVIGVFEQRHVCRSTASMV